MEQENSWRLERGEPIQKGQPYQAQPQPGPQPTYQAHGAESPSDMEESPTSPSSPAGPAIKFNGVPVQKPVPQQAPMMQQPVAMAPMPMPTETSVSTSITSITVDPDWSMADVLCVLYDCACQCQRTLTCIMNSPEAAMRMHQVRMLRDCADICHVTWCFLQRDSRYSLKLLKLCAQICEACADSCAAHMDIDSQRCTATCLRCAVACRSFIAAHL